MTGCWRWRSITCIRITTARRLHWLPDFRKFRESWRRSDCKFRGERQSRGGTNSMKALITGGAGFLGAWIAKRLLAGGHEVRIFDRSADRRLVMGIVGADASKIEWLTGDIANGNEVLEAAEGCGAIAHLAALLTPACQADPVRGVNVNLVGTINVFEAARRHGIPNLTYASSAAVFGPDDGTHPYPMTIYGVFKLACEGVARAFAEDHGVASVGFRPLIVYGPGRETGA